MRAKLKPLGLPEGIAKSTTNMSKLRASSMFKATMVSLATSTSKPARTRWASTVRAKVGSSSTTITLCMTRPPVLLGGLNRLPCSRLFVDAAIPQPQLETREHWQFFELSPRLCQRIRVRSCFDVVGDQDFAVGAKVAAAIASHWASSRLRLSPNPRWHVVTKRATCARSRRAERREETRRWRRPQDPLICDEHKHRPMQRQRAIRYHNENTVLAELS